MPTALTHAVVALAAGKICFARPMPARFWVLAAACSVGPDLDSGLRAFGVNYEQLWGHRGMTHSLVFAFAVALIVVATAFGRDAPWFSRRWWNLFSFFFLITASHGFLDAFTNGGLGIAFFAPFDRTRYFMPWTPIQVAPLGVSRMFTSRGAQVMASEILWLWIPLLAILAAVIMARRKTGAIPRDAGDAST